MEETMKYVWLLITALLLASCGEKSSTQTVSTLEPQPTPLEWHEAQNSIAAYRELQPDRPILAAFTSKWEIPFAIDALQTAETEQVLARHHCLCLIYPTETRESIGTSECQRLGNHLPLVVLSLPGQPDRLFKPEYNKQAAQEFVTEITTILEEYAQSKAQPTATTDHE
ncbi:hypothetical protein SAMN02745181_2103 [Rubritalea squalenifaciens DSM 18772]|uniref:Uncharacterized protein n=2 Tax=Rubritalea squalenifaciens TaxID=407226 RepID=A0A1M6JEZ6_9BACT|nr:hypothetical protein SAMN02745181_2103 [Rubritalea squalenifaciens DSM 18772]